MKEAYFERFGYFSRFITDEDLNWDLAIVIPAYAEEFNEDLFQSLVRNISSIRNNIIGVIWVVNYAENALPENKAISNAFRVHLQKQIKEASIEKSMFIVYLPDLPSKKSGVGVARKAGMDESIHHLKEDGVIACLDADCSISENYATSIIDHFKNSKTWATSIDYAHDLEQEEDSQLRNAAIEYELHLRYFIEMQRRLQLPFAFHTIGSSMAVRSAAYIKMGGMNTRKAGEDFYFLQKHITYGYVDECHTTCVKPSCRTSFRVPFGTGKAIGDMIINDSRFYMTYHPDCFKKAQFLFDPQCWYDGRKVQDSRLWNPFLEKSKWFNRMAEIRKNTRGIETFTKRFYSYADAFMLMKALHYLRDEWKGNIPVHQAIGQAFPDYNGMKPELVLGHFREKQKNSRWDRKEYMWR